MSSAESARHSMSIGETCLTYWKINRQKTASSHKNKVYVLTSDRGSTIYQNVKSATRYVFHILIADFLMQRKLTAIDLKRGDSVYPLFLVLHPP